MATGTLKAGVAQIDVSPPKGVQLQGYPYKSRENTGVHDPLQAACLVLDDGATRVALITADLVGFEKAYAARIRRVIEHKTGIPAGHVMMSGSHTHSAPRMVTWLMPREVEQGWRVEKEYLDGLAERLVDLVVQACSRRTEASIGFGVGRAGKELGIGGNRHDPGGLADPAVGVMGVQDGEGKWLAVWVKYSLHPTILQVENTLVSADYPGALRQHLVRSRPGAVVMFAQGATGDQSSRYFRKDQSFAEVERFGATIGREAVRVLDTLSPTGDVAVAAASAEVEPVWKELPPVEQLEARIADLWSELRRLEAENAPYVERQTCYLNRLGTEYTLTYARLKAAGEELPWHGEVPAEVQAIRIGSACLVGMPGEIFVRYTLAAEGQSPLRPTFVVTLANGMLPGYVVDEESARDNVFEAGVARMKPQMGQRLVAAAGGLCRSLFAEES